MFNRFFIVFPVALMLLILVSCGGDKALRGSLEVEQDLRISGVLVTTNAPDAVLSPDFDPDRTGDYNIDIGNEQRVQLTVTELVDAESELIAFKRVVATTANRSGREQEQAVTIGQAIEFSVDEGNNLFILRSQSPDGTQVLEYRFIVRRISTVSTLSALSFDDFTGTAADVAVFLEPTSFSSAETDYAVLVPFDVCTLGVRPTSTDSEADIRVNGNSVNSGDLQYLDLPVGETTVTVNVVAESGAETNYVLTITRAGAGDNASDSFRRLSSLVLDGATLSNAGRDGFFCRFTSYAARYDTGVDSFNVTAVPGLDGATVRIGEVNDDGSLTNLVSLPSGEPVSLPLTSGTNRFGVTLSPSDETTPVIHYSLSVERSETTWVEVTNGEQLQAALQNAQPNQEIVLMPGDYTGEAVAAASGMDGVHFYSAASGTEDMPIVLRSVSGTVQRLQGTDMSANTLLQISGDHWHIQRLELNTAANGLILDNADNNIVEQFSVTDMGLRGIIIRNGSDSNTFSRTSVQSVGSLVQAGTDLGEAIVVGSRGVEWTSAPTPGPYEASNNNNRFTGVTLGPNVQGELMDIKEGVVNTVVQYAILNAMDMDADIASAMIVNRGNMTTLSYNTFVRNGNASVSAAIDILDAEADFHTELWGRDTSVFDNIFRLDSLSDEAVIRVVADINDVNVDDNVDGSNELITFDSTAFNTDYISPLYQFQLVSDSTQCFAVENVGIFESTNVNGQTVVADDAAVIGERELVLANTCSDASVQHFDLVNEGDSVITIRPASALNNIVAPLSAGNFVSATSSTVSTLSDLSESLTTSFFLRWRVNGVNADEFYFTNRFNSLFALSSGNVTNIYDTDKQGAITLLNLLTDAQRFKLVPIQP